MEVMELVTIATRFMILGAGIECIFTLVGYVMFSIFSMMQGGGEI